MGDEKFISHLSTLKEIILDEERLVTYVSVSKEFCIHVNESKSLMMKAVDEIRKKHVDTDLNVTYIISGLAGDNRARTLVCSEQDMSDCRKELKLVFFEHIYSINKGKPSVDKVAFMAVTSFDDYQLCSGLLKNNVCTKRTSDEISRLKLCSQESVSDQKVAKPCPPPRLKSCSQESVSDQKVAKPCPPPPKKIKEENVRDTITNGFGVTMVSNVKSEASVKQEKVSPQKDTTMNGNKQKPEVKNTSKPQKGIAGFFSRSDGTSAKKIPKETKNNEHEKKVKSEADNTDTNVEQMDVDTDVAVTEPIKISTSKHEETKKQNAAMDNKSKNKNKSLTQIKKNAKVDKKRKRVLHISDSESEDEKNNPFGDDEDVINEQINMDSEDEIPPTPAANTIKVSSNMLNPRKRRKIVNKTYTDEDGYILTRKEEVYESLSENEDTTDMKENIEKGKKLNDEAKEKTELVKMEVSPKNGKKNGPKNNKKKISPPQKGKQATLMSFFKKA